VQRGLIRFVKEEKSKLQLESLPDELWQVDEWYNFDQDPSTLPGVHVVAWADESTYKGGTMGDRHPLVWYRTLENGLRVIYAAPFHEIAHYELETTTTLLRQCLLWCADLVEKQ